MGTGTRTPDTVLFGGTRLVTRRAPGSAWPIVQRLIERNGGTSS
jgi:hypothetical protein